MSRKNGNQDFISRYTVKNPLGDMPLWNGFEVTDSLSGKDYLLFELQVAKNSRLALDDLKMRGHLFAESSRSIPSILSLQENTDSIFFLLSYSKVTPPAKQLAKIGRERSLRILRELTAEILNTLSSGLFFNNLTVESLIFIDDSPVILPVAFLVPGEVIGDSSFPADAGRLDPLLSDIRSLGMILRFFQRFLPEASTGTCGDLSDRICSISTETGPEDYYALMEDLSDFIGMDAVHVPPFYLKERLETPYISGMKMVLRLASAATRG